LSFDSDPDMDTYATGVTLISPRNDTPAMCRSGWPVILGLPDNIAVANITQGRRVESPCVGQGICFSKSLSGSVSDHYPLRMAKLPLCQVWVKTSPFGERARVRGKKGTVDSMQRSSGLVSRTLPWKQQDQRDRHQRNEGQRP
jgi:hypothetical protein